MHQYLSYKISSKVNKKQNATSQFHSHKVPDAKLTEFSQHTILQNSYSNEKD